MKGSKIFGTLTIILGCAAVLFLSETPKVIKYKNGDIKDFSSVAYGELKKGDLVQGTIDITDGCFAEMEETNTTFGIPTSKRTSAQYYACYTCNDFYVVYQTGNSGQINTLDKMADETEAYYTEYQMLAEDAGENADFSQIHQPTTTLDFTGEVENMSSDLRNIFREWYGEGFKWELYAAALVTAIPYTIGYAVSNVVFLLVLGRPFGEKLQRVKIKYGV